MAKPIINLDELQYSEFGKGNRFHAERAPVSPQIGAKKLGYAVVNLKPGKCAWPFRAGDFICSPADPNQPHQIINTSDDDLTYIALSTAESTDVFLYPDSGKYGVWHGAARDPDAPDAFMEFARKETAVDYWDGESD